MRFAKPLLGSAIALPVLAGCNGLQDGVVIDPTTPEAIPCEEVAGTLARTQPGETVKVQACTLTGTITVPAGVTLEGAGIDKTIIEGPSGAAAVVLVPYEQGSETTLKGVTVTSKGTSGVVAIGAGSAAISEASIRATRGIGVGAEDLTSFAISDVTLAGNDGNHIADEMTPETAATYGIALVRVEKATLTGTSVGTFAGFGAVFVDSGVDWTGGSASENDGVGVMVIGGDATLTNLEICGTQQGNRTAPAYGVIATSPDVVTGEPMPSKPGATMYASGIDVCNNLGIGMLYDHGTQLNLSGMSSFTGNVFAGMLVADSSGITAKDVNVSGTKVTSLAIGDQGMTIDGGDGIQLIRSTTGISFDNVYTNMNDRGGLLIDTDLVDPGQAGFMWNNVDVQMNAEFGAVCQWGAVVAAPNGSSGWDTGIVRDTTTEAMDTSFTSPIDVVGFVDPNDIPAPTELLQNGLSGIGVR